MQLSHTVSALKEQRIKLVVLQSSKELRKFQGKWNREIDRKVNVKQCGKFVASL